MFGQNGISRQKVIIIICILLLLGVIEFIFLGKYFEKKRLEQENLLLTQNQGRDFFTDNIEDENRDISEKNYKKGAIYSVIGNIYKLKEDSLLLKTNDNEFKEITITKATKIKRLEFIKSEEENKRLVNEIALEFTDLKAGDYVEVVSEKDIRFDEKFDAMYIRILK